MKNTFLLLLALAASMVSFAQSNEKMWSVFTWDNAAVQLIFPDGVKEEQRADSTIVLSYAAQGSSDHFSVTMQMIGDASTDESDLAQSVAHFLLSNGFDENTDVDHSYNCIDGGFVNGVIVSKADSVDNNARCVVLHKVLRTNHYFYAYYEGTFSLVRDMLHSASSLAPFYNEKANLLPVENALANGSDGTRLFRDIFRTMAYSLGVYNERYDNNKISLLANTYQAIMGRPTMAYDEAFVDQEAILMDDNSYIFRITFAEELGANIVAIYNANEQVGSIPAQILRCELNTSPDGNRELSVALSENADIVVEVSRDGVAKMSLDSTDPNWSPEKHTGKAVSWLSLFK